MHKFSRMESNFNEKTLIESANHFINFTQDAGSYFVDVMDVVYFARAVENYLPYLERARSLVS